MEPEQSSQKSVQKAEILVKGLRQASGIDRRIWNALIHAYAESGLYEKARAVFDNMIKTGPLPTVDLVNGMMRALIVDGRLDEDSNYLFCCICKSRAEGAS
jgi:pentatricopeptide repeat protein